MSLRLLTMLRRVSHTPCARGGLEAWATSCTALCWPTAKAAAAFLARPPHHPRTFISLPWPGRAPQAGPAGPSTRAQSAEDADEARCLADLRTAVAAAAGANFGTYEDAAAFAAEAGVSVGAVSALQAKLGHAWAHPWLLRAALTHLSWRAETTPTGTQPLLAWVGDAALQGIVTDELVARYACSGARPPSQLTVTRSLVLSRAGCARHARVLGLAAEGADAASGRLLAVGGSFTSIGAGLSTGMLGECFEAVLGAVYIDGGRAAARAAFLRLLPFPPTLAEVATQYGAEANLRKLARMNPLLEAETGLVVEAGEVVRRKGRK